MFEMSYDHALKHQYLGSYNVTWNECSTFKHVSVFMNNAISLLKSITFAIYVMNTFMFRLNIID